MMNNPKLQKAAGAVRLVFGILVIIVAGLLFTLDNFGLVSARFLLRLWPVALVAVGLTKALQRRGFWNGFWGWVIALAGVLLLLDNLDVLRFPVWKLMPLILVAVGIRLVQKAGGGPSPTGRSRAGRRRRSTRRRSSAAGTARSRRTSSSGGRSTPSSAASSST